MSNQELSGRLLDVLPTCESAVIGQPLSAEQASELAKVFKAVGDPIRLRLLSLIASHAGGEACVCDLTGAFDLTGPTISHHLKVLREAGLITGERRATWVYYRVRPEMLTRLSEVLAPTNLSEAGV
ncbi:MULTISPECIES: ArsR/SmtB family transcription factor [Actinoalloteichus]|uniref:Transcriptional regulator n=1 Tax=Actinoalloteichus fjordicus TaxID=1612552 RepID=A0AAC9PTI6_9PSEU|nr:MULTISPECIES: metalloregulator ArsR/SmtB family transcription factor [Actinoalloteichus]APU15921.1 putative transcriptional regulator [Actinoalloteichus fjordicus]APU21983.1 putative transcriptional regulator [Actinoalloteichus sp. GBA129-24]